MPPPLPTPMDAVADRGRTQRGGQKGCGWGESEENACDEVDGEVGNARGSGRGMRNRMKLSRCIGEAQE